MFGYMKIRTPEGKKVRVAKNLYLKLADKIAADQVYEFYDKFLTFLDGCPVKTIVELAEKIYEKIEEDNFLYRLNASTDKEGNVDWKYFFDDVEFA